MDKDYLVAVPESYKIGFCESNSDLDTSTAFQALNEAFYNKQITNAVVSVLKARYAALHDALKK